MFCSTPGRLYIFARNRLAPDSKFLLCLAFFCAGPINAQVVAEYDFEDGTVQNWTPIKGANTPVNSTAAAYTGSHSLLTTTSTNGGGGPSILLSSTLRPGGTYQITGYIRLTRGENAAFANFTMKRSDPRCSGGACYDTIGTYAIQVSASGWVQVGGIYTVNTTETALALYAQLVGATKAQSYYLDDVVINEISAGAAAVQDNSGIATPFEDGGLDGWTSHVGAALANSTAEAHGGYHSLLISGRTAAYDGPQINVSDKMYNGSTYSISVWVKLAPSATQSDTLRLTLQVTLAGTTTYRSVVGNTQVLPGSWANLTIPNYQMANSYDPGGAYLYIESNSGTQSFYVDEFRLTYLPPILIQTNIPSIYRTLASNFHMGASVATADLSGPHAQLLATHFDSITSESDMQWTSMESVEGTFTFAPADAEVNFARSNNMQVRGHDLVWATGQAAPPWVFLEPDGQTPLSSNNPADVTLLTQRIQNHIKGVVQHFSSSVYLWEVVNEPIDPSQPDCLEHGPFYQVLGKSYIDIALQAARLYAPQGTQLFINDYSTTYPGRLACLISLVQDLRGRSIPIDGIGHEMHNHIDDNPSTAAMIDAVNAIANALPDLYQHITEMDMSVYGSSDNTSDFGANNGAVPPSLVAEQGWLYEQYFTALRQLKGKVTSVSFWGFGDDHTWLDSFPINRLDLPLPFDARLQAKPAYWGIVDPTRLPG